MYLLSAFLFALSANIDSFIIGLSCGIRQTKITVPKSLLISLITLCGTAAALIAGSRIVFLFPFSYAEFTGKFILLVFGLYYAAKFLFMNVFQPFLKYFIRRTPTDPAPPELPTDPVGMSLSWKYALLYGLSLSINNLGIGLGASISGIEPLSATCISFILSFGFLLIGNHAGHSVFFRKTEKYADLFCGLLLILLGIFC